MICQIMEHPRNGHGGLWNCPRPTQYSKETQDMLKCRCQVKNVNISMIMMLLKCLITEGYSKRLTLKHKIRHCWGITVMMEESRLTNFQQRQLSSHLRSKHGVELFLLFIPEIGYLQCVFLLSLG